MHPVRITCPNRDFFTTLTDNNHPFVVNYCRIIMNNTIPSAARVVSRTLNDQGHVWVPTPLMLCRQMQKAGFKDVKINNWKKNK